MVLIKPAYKDSHKTYGTNGKVDLISGSTVLDKLKHESRKLDLGVISTAVYNSMGINGSCSLDGRLSRMCPSAGALYPFEMYVFANLDDMGGVYHYNVMDNTFERIGECSFEDNVQGAFILYSHIKNRSLKYCENLNDVLLLETGHIEHNLFCSLYDFGGELHGGVADERFNELATDIEMPHILSHINGVMTKFQGFKITEKGKCVFHRDAHYKIYPGAETVDCVPFSTEFSEQIRKRRSIRHYSQEKVSLEELSTIMHGAMVEAYSGFEPLVPIHAYVLALNVAGMNGLYFHNTRNKTFEKVDDCPSRKGIFEILNLPQNAISESHHLANSGFMVFLSYDKNIQTSEPSDRNIALLKSGFIAQNILAGSTLHDVGAVPLAYFNKEAVGKKLQFNDNEEMLYLVVGGKMFKHQVQQNTGKVNDYEFTVDGRTTVARKFQAGRDFALKKHIVPGDGYVFLIKQFINPKSDCPKWPNRAFDEGVIMIGDHKCTGSFLELIVITDKTGKILNDMPYFASGQSCYGKPKFRSDNKNFTLSDIREVMLDNWGNFEVKLEETGYEGFYVNEKKVFELADMHCRRVSHHGFIRQEKHNKSIGQIIARFQEVFNKTPILSNPKVDLEIEKKIQNMASTHYCLDLYKLLTCGVIPPEFVKFMKNYYPPNADRYVDSESLELKDLNGLVNYLNNASSLENFMIANSPIAGWIKLHNFILHIAGECSYSQQGRRRDLLCKSREENGFDNPLFKRLSRELLEEEKSQVGTSPGTVIISAIDDVVTKYAKLRAVKDGAVLKSLGIIETFVQKITGGAIADKKGGVTAQAGRNQPCPCGSGKKYKKCCG